MNFLGSFDIRDKAVQAIQEAIDVGVPMFFGGKEANWRFVQAKSNGAAIILDNPQRKSESVFEMIVQSLT